MKHILLVEDNLGDARFAEAMLAESAEFDADVTCVGRLSQAVNLLASQPVDLVLLDLSLPDSTGLEGLRQLQALSNDAPIIVLSGIDDKALALEALKRGAQDYLLKGTMDAEALSRAVQYSIERKTAELRYRSLVANIPGTVYRCHSDSQWSMLFVSSQFETLTGYLPDEFWEKYSCHYEELIHPDDYDRATRVVREAVSRRQPYSVEYRILHKDMTTRWVLDRGKGIGGADGLLPSRDGVLFDITEQKRMETLIRKSEQQLNQAQQYAVLGNLAGGVAHDFNNLITAINGFTDLVINELASDSRSHTRLLQIRKAGERAMMITQQLLALGKTAEQEFTFLDLNLLLADMERMIRLVTGSPERIELITDPLLGRVRGCPGQLEQALLILVVNLSTGRSGDLHLQIETSSWDVSKDDAESLGFVFGGPYVAVTLRARPQDHLSTASCPFIPLMAHSEIVNDVGFGMANVLKIMTEHQGYFLVSRDDGRVLEYKIILPIAQITHESLVFNQATPSYRAGSETVLVVDDEESIRVLLADLLEARGYRVLQASNSQEALRFSEQFREPIDLLIADIVMPGMGGQELAAQLARARPRLKVLLMSTLMPDGRNNSNAFLLKPFASDTLLRRIEEALQERDAQLLHPPTQGVSGVSE